MLKKPLNERIQTLKQHLLRRLDQLETYRKELQPEELCFIRQLALENVEAFEKEIKKKVTKAKDEEPRPKQGVPWIIVAEENGVIAFIITLEDKSKKSIVIPLQYSFKLHYDHFLTLTNEIKEEIRTGMADNFLTIPPDLYLLNKLDYKNRLMRRTISDNTPLSDSKLRKL